MKSKELEYLSIIWHEIRTPLTSIRWYISMILEWDMWEISDEARKALNHCYDSSLRLIKLSNDVLSISKLENWKMEYFPIKFNLKDFLISIYNDIFVEAEIKKVNILIEIDKNLKNIELFYDKDRLKQVFLNILTNAIKFTDVWWKVTIKATKKEKNILFEIIDTWIWIPEEKIWKIFDKFWQISWNFQRENKLWLWLWLNLAKNILKDFWSEIKVKSVFKEWSNFYFELKI